MSLTESLVPWNEQRPSSAMHTWSGCKLACATEQFDTFQGHPRCTAIEPSDGGTTLPAIEPSEVIQSYQRYLRGAQASQERTRYAQGWHTGVSRCPLDVLKRDRSISCVWLVSPVLHSQ